MTSPAPDHSHPEADATSEAAGVRTGVAEVDAVLDSLAGLEGRPVAEHPARFESAHDRLRRSLDGTG